MAVVAGDIKEITYNHPTIGSGRLFAKAKEDSTFDLGGFRGDDDKNNVDGGGRNIKKLNRNRWSIKVPCSWDMNISNELDKISKMAGDPVDAEWTVESINGTVWAGTGSPVGDVEGNGGAGTLDLNISGGGEMTKIVG